MYVKDINNRLGQKNRLSYQAKNQSKYSLDKKQKDADKQELLKLLSTKGNRKGKSKLKCCITKTDLK